MKDSGNGISVHYVLDIEFHDIRGSLGSLDMPWMTVMEAETKSRLADAREGHKMRFGQFLSISVTATHLLILFLAGNI